MASLEAAAIAAVCKNKDIHSLLGAPEEVFQDYSDIISFITKHQSEHKSIPDYSFLTEKFPDLPKDVDVSGPTEHYITEAKQGFLKGKMRGIMEKANEGLQNKPASEILDALSERLAGLTKYSQTITDLNLNDSQAALDYFEKIREISKANDGVPGVTTGFKAIDSVYTTGMAPGHLVVLFGFTGKGKSFLALKLAVTAWQKGYRPLFVSLEMTPEEVRERAYPMIESGKFKNSELSRGIAPGFEEWAVENLANTPSFIVPDLKGYEEVTPRMVRGMAEKHQADLIVYDYAQLGMDNAKSGAMTQRMMNLSRELKVLSTDLGKPVIMISGVTDDPDEKRDAPPHLHQVAWSNGIEYSANLAMAVHRHESGLIEVAGRKNRHGELFNFFIDVDLDSGKFIERFDL